MTESITPVSAGQALQSMRDSDFDCYSAYAEAIDNAIQANATKIHIEFQTETKVRNYEHITKVAFVDNGDGMVPNLIHNCLVLGYSSRFNDRSGIGRFGVGMTMGAIHECQNVSVYSRITNDEKWLSTSLDISTPNDVAVRIDPPKESKFPSWLEHLEPECSGTLVEWTNYDRQVENGTKIIAETKIYFGRVFRKFIWSGVSIFVNGEPVYAIDPLYATVKGTKFPNDKPATLATPIQVEWLVPPDIADREGQTDTITINLSLLPSDIRGKRQTGTRKEVKDRYIDRNQGISIMRNGREVAYGAVPYWPGASLWFNEIDRWWGCEIEFSPLLDRIFQVKNIKRGAVPVTELKTMIFEQINPTVKGYLDSIRREWDERAERDEGERADKGEHNSGHKVAEGIVKTKNIEDTSLPVDDPEGAGLRLIGEITKYREAGDKLAILEAWKSQPYTIEESTWKGRDFIELKSLGGHDVVLYNNSHVLMKRIKELAENIAKNSDSESKALALELKCVVDLLLLAYVKAESKLSKNPGVIDLLETLRTNWGMYAHTYITEMAANKNDK